MGFMISNEPNIFYKCSYNATYFFGTAIELGISSFLLNILGHIVVQPEPDSLKSKVISFVSVCFTLLVRPLSTIIIKILSLRIFSRIPTITKPEGLFFDTGPESIIYGIGLIAFTIFLTYAANRYPLQVWKKCSPQVGIMAILSYLSLGRVLGNAKDDAAFLLLDVIAASGAVLGAYISRDSISDQRG